MFRVKVNSKEKGDVLAIIDYALRESSVEKVMKSSVKLEKNKLKIKDKVYNLDKYQNLYVLGSGKASWRMAEAINSILGERISGGVIIYTKKGKIGKISVEKATHPFPSKFSLNATRKLLEFAKNIKERDLTIYLLSGGSSSMLCYPKIKLDKFIELNKKLVTSGKNIREINEVRIKHSNVKGGKLLKYIKGKIVNLVISDVVGDSLKYIGSGPLYSRSKRVDNIIVANNYLLLKKAEERARLLGYKTRILYPNFEGSPKELAEKFLKVSKKLKPKTCVISGGELNVKVKGNGRGGPNQEFVLFCHEIKGTIASIDSDGIDGNSKAAGGIADEKDFKFYKPEYLKNHNSYLFFKKIKGAIITGPTGTNLNELRIMVK